MGNWWKRACNYGDCVVVFRNRFTNRVTLSTTRRKTLAAVIDPDEWTEFLAAVKRGDFDDV